MERFIYQENKVTGSYEYEDTSLSPGTIEFQVFSIDKLGNVVGSGSDDSGVFTLAGSCSDSGEVKFTKDYSDRKIAYAGRIEIKEHGLSITGSWNQVGQETWKGSFSLTCEHKNEEQPPPKDVDRLCRECVVSCNVM